MTSLSLHDAFPEAYHTIEKMIESWFPQKYKTFDDLEEEVQDSFNHHLFSDHYTFEELIHSCSNRYHNTHTSYIIKTMDKITISVVRYTMDNYGDDYKYETFEKVWNLYGLFCAIEILQDKYRNLYDDDGNQSYISLDYCYPEGDDFQRWITKNTLKIYPELLTLF